MKTFLAMLVTAGLMSAPAFAAIEKGNSELGASLSYAGGSTTYDFMGTSSVTKTSNLSAMFSYGYFASAKVQIGAIDRKSVV